MTVYRLEREADRARAISTSASRAKKAKDMYKYSRWKASTSSSWDGGGGPKSQAAAHADDPQVCCPPRRPRERAQAEKAQRELARLRDHAATRYRPPPPSAS